MSSCWRATKNDCQGIYVMLEGQVVWPHNPDWECFFDGKVAVLTDWG